MDPQEKDGAKAPHPACCQHSKGETDRSYKGKDCPQCVSIEEAEGDQTEAHNRKITEMQLEIERLQETNRKLHEGSIGCCSGIKALLNERIEQQSETIARQAQQIAGQQIADDVAKSLRPPSPPESVAECLREIETLRGRLAAMRVQLNDVRTDRRRMIDAYDRELAALREEVERLRKLNSGEADALRAKDAKLRDSLTSAGDEEVEGDPTEAHNRKIAEMELEFVRLIRERDKVACQRDAAKADLDRVEELARAHGFETGRVVGFLRGKLAALLPHPGGGMTLEQWRDNYYRLVAILCGGDPDSTRSVMIRGGIGAIERRAKSFRDLRDTRMNTMRTQLAMFRRFQKLVEFLAYRLITEHFPLGAFESLVAEAAELDTDEPEWSQDSTVDLTAIYYVALLLDAAETNAKGERFKLIVDGARADLDRHKMPNVDEIHNPGPPPPFGGTVEVPDDEDDEKCSECGGTEQVEQTSGHGEFLDIVQSRCRKCAPPIEQPAKSVMQATVTIVDDTQDMTPSAEGKCKAPPILRCTRDAVRDGYCEVHARG